MHNNNNDVTNVNTNTVSNQHNLLSLSAGLEAKHPHHKTENNNGAIETIANEQSSSLGNTNASEQHAVEANKNGKEDIANCIAQHAPNDTKNTYFDPICNNSLLTDNPQITQNQSQAAHLYPQNAYFNANSYGNGFPNLSYPTNYQLPSIPDNSYNFNYMAQLAQMNYWGGFGWL